MLQGQQVNLTDSELTQGQSVSLTATAGDVNTSGSRVAANGQLVLSSTGKLINQSGVLEADQFSIAVQAIDNRSGRIQQFGAHDLALSLAGELDNRDKGIIAAQQGALRVQAQSIQNQTGLLSQSGTASPMSLQASQLLDGSGGNIESSGGLDISANSVVLDDAYTLANGSLTLTSAEQISHQNALMVQQGQGDLRLTAGAGFNNAGSQIGGSGNVSIAAASLDNVNGHIQTGETGNLSVSVDGQIDNSHDADLSGATPAKGLRSGGALTVQAGDLKNDSGLIAAGQQLDISLVNDLGSNQDGLIVATGNASLAASHIDNRGGQLLSQLGQTTLTARSNIPAPDQASLDNAGGIIAGHTGVSINAHSLNNQSGQITLAQSDSSGSVVIDTRGGALNNAQGDISGQDISVASGDIDNRGGRISASGKLDLVLPGHQLTNQDSNLAGLSQGTQKGISSQGALTIEAAAVDNDGGLIGTQDSLSVQAARIVNGGLVSAGQNASLVTMDLVNHGAQTGGVIQAGQTLTVEATGGRIDNTGGQLSAGQVVLRADQVANQANPLPLWAAIWSVLSLFISYWGSSSEARWVWPLY